VEEAAQDEEGREEGGREEVAHRTARGLASRTAVSAALAAIEALGEGRPLRLALGSALAAHPGLGPKERRHAAVAARSVARWLRVCDAALVRARAPRSIPADRALLRYLAWRIAVLGEAPDAVARALRLPGPRRPRALGDAELRSVARALPRPGPLGPLSLDASGRLIPPPADPVTALGLRHSVPDALVRRILAALGPAEAAECLAALNREPVITLRVNVARSSRGAVLDALRGAGVAAEEGTGPLSVRVRDRARLFDAPAFRQGLAEVQDEGSQAVVDLCAPAEGERWLDLCAGSGGKALGLAALGARVTAWDANPRRLSELPRRARRAGLEVLVSRSEPAGTFDGVLVDAPCSGSGALAREPDARWRIDDAAVSRFREGQLAILDRAAPRVRKGGRLVYATCSLFREEGEEVVERFLAGHAGFSLAAETRRWPHRQEGAGFFMAQVEREGAPALATGRGRRRPKGRAGPKVRTTRRNPRRGATSRLTEQVGRVRKPAPVADLAARER